MFFGYNVGSTIHRVVGSDTNILYEPVNPVIDNFVSNLWSNDDITLITPHIENGRRSDNMFVVSNIAAPYLYYDCWLGTDKIGQTVEFMHLPAIIHVTNPLMLEKTTYQKYRNLLFVCYDEDSLKYLTKEIGLQKCYLLPPVLSNEFVSQNLSLSNKTIDLTILQNDYDKAKLEQIANAIQNSVPSLKIEISESISTNEYISDLFSHSKLMFSVDPISAIEVKYATCFGTILMGGDARNIHYPGLTYQTTNIEEIVKTTNSLLADYTNLFNKLLIEKNKLLLSNNLNTAQNDIKQILNAILDRTTI
jgi:hypothetical protein